MKPPILIIGTHRSGTTWLGEAFSRSMEVAYWLEPRQVWEYGNWRKGDDVLTASDAAPYIRNHIRTRFHRFVTSRGAERLCEKTPSNCLRIPFLHSVFPEAKIVFIYRDGRAVLRSTQEMKKTGAEWYRIRDRLNEFTLSEAPAYLSRLPLLVRKIFGRPVTYWGPRPPGWQVWLKNDAPHILAAKQWAHTIMRAWTDLEDVCADQVLRIKYERLVHEPEPVVEELCRFTGLKDPRPVRNYLLQTANPRASFTWRKSLNPQLLAEIRPILEPVLFKLGYSWN